MLVTTSKPFWISCKGRAKSKLQVANESEVYLYLDIGPDADVTILK